MSSVRRPVLSVAVSCLLVALAFSYSLAAEAPEEDARPGETKWGTFGLYLRYRFEGVDDDAFTEDGYASTLRTVLSYRTPDWHALEAFIEFADVANLGAAGAHNDTTNGVTERPTISDPEFTLVQQILARYDGITDTGFIAGRQEIKLGNERYVGASGWRQIHQTFDSVRVVQESIPHTTWTYAYVAQANTVTGQTDRMHTNLLDAAIEIADAGTLTPYLYSIDYDDAPRTTFSTNSYGARWEGTCKVGNWSVPYLAEGAHQEDTGDNPGTVDAGYYHLVAGGELNDMWFNVGLEVLGGSVADGQFNTPLATLYKFNGWADKFLVMPADGLRDLYVGVGGTRRSVSVVGAYHHFDSDSRSIDYGTELDAQATYTAPWNQVFALTMAFYDADELFEDTFKVWAWTTYEF
jgi:hypothetical protein